MDGTRLAASNDLFQPDKPQPTLVMKTKHKSHFLGILPLLVLCGCAGDLARNPYHSPPPTEAIRARLGRVAIQTVSTETQTKLVKPYTPGQAAAAEAWEALGEIPGGSGGGVVVLVPFAVLAGGIVGGMRGTPKGEIDPAWNGLYNACYEVDFQETVRRNVTAAMRKYTRQPVAQTGQARNVPHADSMLEINVLQAGLAGTKYKGAGLNIFLQVQARLVSLPDGTELYKHIWLHNSDERTFNAWAAQDARQFRQGLAVASRDVADDMVREIFLGQAPSKGGGRLHSRSPDNIWPDTDLSIR